MKRTIVGALAALLALAYPLQAAPPPQNVTVINDVANPVPVSLGGPVSVDGTVRTAPANNPTPVSRFAVLLVDNTTGREDRQTIYTVPAGKRLMIESETAMTIASGELQAMVSVVAWNLSGGALFYDVLPQIDRGWWDGQGQIYEGSNAIPMFADAGQKVEARAWANKDPVPAGASVRVEVGFSGYLVDLP
jgi:hypothetical protein